MKRTLAALILVAVLLGICGIACADTLYIPAGTKVIEEEAFYGDTSIDEVVLPEGIEKIGARAFANSGLKKVNLPDSLKYIAEDAFDTGSVIKFSAKYGSPAYEWLKERNLIEEETDPSNFTFSDADNGTVKITGFSDKSNYPTSILIPVMSNDGNLITSIDEKAFQNCTNLVSVKIQENITAIEDGAFSGCSALKTVELSEGLVSLRGKSYPRVSSSIGVFSGCSSLKEIHLPNTCKVIGGKCFYKCSSLESINIPEGVTELNYYCFYQCSNLKDIYLPSTLRSLGEYDFGYCTSLQYVNIPSKVTYIPNGLFYGCKKLISIAIPDSAIKTISKHAFFECEKLVNFVIPDSVTTIGENAFSGCKSLSGISVPDGVKKIELSTFSGCSSLKSIHLPDSITAIGYWAFQNCTSLESIHLPSELTQIGANLFAGCSSLVSVDFPSQLLTIEGRAFSGCTSLKRIEIPDTVTRIAPETFYGCTALEYIKLSSNITQIYENTFTNCTKLKNISLPDSITQIGSSAFSGCTKLLSLVIPSNVTTIGSNAFRGCTGLLYIYLPESVEEIGDWAFYDCNLMTIYTSENTYAYDYAEKEKIARVIGMIPDYESEELMYITHNTFVVDGKQYSHATLLKDCMGIKEGVLLFFDEDGSPVTDSNVLSKLFTMYMFVDSNAINSNSDFIKDTNRVADNCEAAACFLINDEIYDVIGKTGGILLKSMLSINPITLFDASFTAAEIELDSVKLIVQMKLMRTISKSAINCIEITNDYIASLRGSDIYYYEDVENALELYKYSRALTTASLSYTRPIIDDELAEYKNAWGYSAKNLEKIAKSLIKSCTGLGDNSAKKHAAKLLLFATDFIQGKVTAKSLFKKLAKYEVKGTWGENYADIIFTATDFVKSLAEISPDVVEVDDSCIAGYYVSDITTTALYKNHVILSSVY